MTVLIDASGVEATSIAVNAASRDQREREGSALERESGDDLHETKNGDRNQISREKVFELRESTNNREVKHKQRIHRGREKAVLVIQRFALRNYVKQTVNKYPADVL